MLCSRAILQSGLLAVLVTPSARARQGGVDPALDGFDPWVQSVMAEWHVPGLAVGVVKDGRVVLARGYGWREVETKAPVTARTVMGIASNTKSFTAVLMGMLVGERRLEWERPVRDYLPDFQLADPFATGEMTPKDLLTHRSGLPRHDNLWYGQPFTRPELVDRLRYLERTASFRSRYQYSNLMFVAAGYLIEQVTGRRWDELIRERIFLPLGMTRSSTSVTDITRADDFAYPYIWRGAALARLPFRNIDAVAPAGGINSSVDDMLKYIQFRLDQGVVGDRRLLSGENEALMQRPEMPTGSPVLYPELGHDTYGLGLHVDTYRGRRNLGHGGQIDGFVSAMNWLPAERIGVVVLTNEGDNPLPSMVVRTLYDRLLGFERADWVARQRKADAEAARRRDQVRQALLATRKPDSRPSHPLSAYEGVYRNPAYGDLTVKVEGEALMLLTPRRARLEHFHYDVWEVIDPGETVPFTGLLRFETNERGEIATAHVPLEPALRGVVFVK